MWLNRTTAPTETPITLAEAKAHIRVDFDNDDTLITALIAAATEHLDGRRGYLGRCLVTQSWEYRVDIFPWKLWDAIEIPMPPLVSVQSVKYIDDNGAEQTLATSVYVVDVATPYGQIRLAYDQEWPATRDEPHAVRIAFAAGFGAASAVPQPIKSALLMLVGHLYANRDAVTAQVLAEMPMGARYLLGPYRTVNL